jgi:hypothetical protein
MASCKLLILWRPRRDLNPCYRRERAVSWAGLDDGDASIAGAEEAQPRAISDFTSKQGAGYREQGAGIREPGSALLGALGGVAAGLKAQTAFEEAHGQHDDEGKEGAEDPADEAFEDEEHRVSDGAGRESGFAEEYHSAVKGRGKGRGIGERGSGVGNSREQGGGRREEGGRRRRRGRSGELGAVLLLRGLRGWFIDEKAQRGRI